MTGQEARDEEREALIDAMINVAGADGQVEFAEDDREPAGHLADAILAAGFRKLPELGEMLDRTARTLFDRAGASGWRSGWEHMSEATRAMFRSDARAALEAALGVPVGEGEQ